MIAQFIREHLFMSSILAFGMAGIFLQGMMALSLQGYVKASANMKTTRKKLLMNLKNQFETIYGMHYQMRNIAAYVDKYLLKMRFLGISYPAWERVPFLQIGFSTLLAGGEAFYAYWMKQPMAMYVEIGFAYGVVCVLQFVCFHVFSISGKRRQIHIQLVDYLENYLANRLLRTKEEGEAKLLDEDMEAAFMDGSAKNKELKAVILEEDRQKEKKQKQRERDEDMEMLKRLLRDVESREPALPDEVAVADDNVEMSDIELLEEFVQSFLA